VKALSGGERGRLMLARALAKPSNLLILDEPTNDLDLETLDLLQEMLAAYPGTLLLVSHDRDFLDRIVTTTIAGEGDGNWTVYAGGYSDMLAQRGEILARKPQAKAATVPAKAVPPPVPPAQRRKLTFADQHALKTLPERMEKLSAAIAELNAKLSAADFYARDPAGFDRATKALADAQAQLSAAEEEWLRIEMLREELERG
jgi:ATP-binding cassette subfamily F protein uup